MTHTQGKLVVEMGADLIDERSRIVATCIVPEIPPAERVFNARRLALAWNTFDEAREALRQTWLALDTASNELSERLKDDPFCVTMKEALAEIKAASAKARAILERMEGRR